MSVLKIRTQDQLIFIEKPVPILTSGNKNNDVLKVTFDETWDCENGKFYASFYIDDPKDVDIISLTRKDDSFECLIPYRVLHKEGIFNLGVWCEFGDKTKTSNNKEIRVHQGAVTNSNTGESEIDIAVNSAKEEYRSVLETSIETATGENHDNKTWEELNNTVSTLPIISEEQTQALGDWDLIKDYFANYAGTNHHLVATAPKDENGKDMLFKLPYIYTPKLRWNTARPLSQSLVEVGFDVSSAQDLGSQGGDRTLSPYPNLERLVITGNANAASHSCMLLQNTGLLYVKMETPNEDVLKESSDYYYGTFGGCNKLVTIDCELDLTGQTNTTYMFKDCYKLKNLKIKPFTLFTSLDLGACRSLHHNDLNDYDSLISILNGITLDREIAKNITITFSSEITDFTQGMVQYWNKLVYHCDNGMVYSDLSEAPEGLLCLEMSLYDAFILKGVTIAWK